MDFDGFCRKVYFNVLEFLGRLDWWEYFFVAALVILFVLDMQNG